MSNKKKVSVVKYRIGNFVFTKKVGGIEAISVQTVNGEWKMDWRVDSETYLFINELLNQNDEKTNEYLHGWIAVAYMCCNGYKDAKFMEGFSEVYKDFTLRYAEMLGKPQVSEEENQRMINEERQKYESGNK